MDVEEDGDEPGEVDEKTPTKPKEKPGELGTEETPTKMKEKTTLTPTRLPPTETEKEKETTTLKEPEKPKEKPRDVHLVTPDAVLVFSPASTLSSSEAPLSSSGGGEEVLWDVSRLGADGAREVMYTALGKDGVEFGVGGVRFRDVSSPAEPVPDALEGEGEAPMDTDSDETKTETNAAPWGAQVGVVLWRYGS
ncbi:hypothetical protein B0H13DRAFT_1957013 [Mycena leptocephala]|nr:hypothetical protein B0H13DRAFT_1957013 [Mycena leptocephala]